MAGCCGPKCSKTFVILYNILFWISGCAFLALGVLLLVDKSFSFLHILLSEEADKYPRELVDYVAYGCIGIGGVILFVGFFGCCGALQESKCMLGTYIFFLIVICIVEVAIGLGTAYCWYTFPDNTAISRQVKNQWSTKYSFNQDYTEAFNHAQVTMKCCGVDSDNDYSTKSGGSQFNGGGGGNQNNFNSQNYNQNFNSVVYGSSTINNNNNNMNGRAFNFSQTYPLTCCVLSSNYQEEHPWIKPNPENENQCQQSTQVLIPGLLKQRYEKGCLEEILKSFWLYLIIIGASSGGLALLQVVGVLFSVCLIRNIGEEP